MRRPATLPAVVGTLSAWLAVARPARAGMPSATLTDVASLRLSSISFFLVVLLLSAKGVQAIWNGLRGDIPRLPRLSYGKALGVITLWGLLFVLVLTMISGARELMTPGAWRKQGFTYKLADPAESPVLLTASPRREKLERLRAALWRYAHAHEGRFPPDAGTPEISAEVWQFPDVPGLRYLYVAGREPGEPDAVVAYEPGLHGRDRLTLLADGEIRVMTVDEIRKSVESRSPASAEVR